MLYNKQDPSHLRLWDLHDLLTNPNSELPAYPTLIDFFTQGIVSDIIGRLEASTHQIEVLEA